MGTQPDAGSELSRAAGEHWPPAIVQRRFTVRRPNPVFSDEYRVLRDVVRDARIAAGLSQRQLAAGLGKQPPHICMIERGQRRIDTLELYQIAKILGVPPVDLFEAIATRLEALEGGAS